MANRCTAGDWRAVYYDVADPSIDTMPVDVAQGDTCTSLATFAAGRGGRIPSSTAGPASLVGLPGWPSSDWLGPTLFREGGAGSFRPGAGRRP